MKTEKITMSRDTQVFTLLLLSPIAGAVICIILLTFGKERSAFSCIPAAVVSIHLRLHPEGTKLSGPTRKNLPHLPAGLAGGIERAAKVTYPKALTEALGRNELTLVSVESNNGFHGNKFPLRSHPLQA